jgi:hypothetical protein
MIHPGLWPQGMKALQEDILAEAAQDCLWREALRTQRQQSSPRTIVWLQAVWAGLCAHATLALRD